MENERTHKKHICPVLKKYNKEAKMNKKKYIDTIVNLQIYSYKNRTE